MTSHRHLWFTEQQSGHKWCHLCKQHAPESRGECVEREPALNLPGHRSFRDISADAQARRADILARVIAPRPITTEIVGRR